MNNLAIRIITALIGATVLIGAIVWNALGFAIVFGIIMLLTLREFYGLARKSGANPFELWGLILGLVSFSILFYSFEVEPLQEMYWLLPVLFSVVFIYPLIQLNRTNAIDCLAISVLGLFYIALPFCLLIPVAFVQGAYHFELIIGILFIQWANDSGAYFSGKTFGKTKLFEKVSPNKTWEGTIGGALLGLAFAYGFFHFFGVFAVYHWLALGLIISVFGTLGDLVESLFKRTLAIKDSGSSLPGHGGFLDRFDSLLLALPFATAYIHYVI